MANRFEEIARRKQALIDKAAQERAELARSRADLKSSFEVSSTLLGIGRVLKTHPIVAAGLSTFLVSGYAGKAIRSTGKKALADAEKSLVAKSKEAAEIADDYVRENPWSAVGIAAGIGLVLGLLIRVK